MTFYKDLYLSESVKNDARKIIRKIKQNKIEPDAYVIAFATIPGNLLDLIPQWELTQKGYPKEDIQVIGLAKGKKDAISLAQSIIEEVYTETGGLNVREFISSKWEGQV